MYIVAPSIVVYLGSPSLPSVPIRGPWYAEVALTVEQRSPNASGLVRFALLVPRPPHSFPLPQQHTLLMSEYAASSADTPRSIQSFTTFPTTLSDLEELIAAHTRASTSIVHARVQCDIDTLQSQVSTLQAELMLERQAHQVTADALVTLQAEVERLASIRLPSLGTRGMKANPPPVFDGSRQNGESFLHAVSLFIMCSPAQFASDFDRIAFTLSYMSEGRAQTFRNNALDFASHNAERFEWDSFKDFKVTFREEFTPVDAAQDAITTLASPAFHQTHTETLDDYIDRFRVLARRSGMDSLGLLVVSKFKEGLLPDLQLLVRDMTSPPEASNPEEWYHRLRAICTQRDQFNAMFRVSASPALPVSHARVPYASVSPPAPPAPPPLISPPLGTEIKTTPPSGVEVRHLDTEELEEELARRRDLAEIATREKAIAASQARSEEDFGTPSE